MAQQQQNLTFSSPGYFGLNTEESPLNLDPSYALVADNAVVDSNGRIGSRKAFAEYTTAFNLTYSTDPLTTSEDIQCHSIGAYPVGGNVEVLVTVSVTQQSAAGAITQQDYFLCKVNNPSSDVFEVDELTIPSLTDASKLTNAQMVLFNDLFYVFSEGNDPLIYDGSTVEAMSASSGYFAPEDDTGVLAAKVNGDVACAAYGRLWVTGVEGDYQNIFYSDLLIGNRWFDGKATVTPGNETSTAGIIDVSEYWPNGQDRIVGLVAHNNFLLVFGRNSLLVYTGVSEDPAAIGGLTLSDSINNIGLVSRDAVARIGSDVIFIDDSGLRSLGRTIQEKSAPIGSLSVNIHKDFTSIIDATENKSTISLSYWISENLVVAQFAEKSTAYVFESRNPAPSGGLKVTRWTNTNFNRALFYESGDNARVLLTGSRNNAGVLEYKEFLEYTNEPYIFKFETGQLSFGSPANKKFLKKIDYTLASSFVDAQAVAQWGYNSRLEYSKPFTVTSTPPALFGQALFGVSLFGGAQINIRRYKANTKGSGENVVIGFRADIKGNSCSIQEINVQTLLGRIN